MLEVCELHGYYGSSHVIQGVSLRVANGEFLAIVGRNGAGKSTLMHNIIGFLPPRRGTVAYGGIDLTDAEPYRHADAGMALVPQGRRIFPSLTIEEHLRVARPRRAAPRTWTEAKVFEIFPRLAERRRNRGDQLSGGEQQMLAIGRALMQNPTLLMLDEPTEGLAPVITSELGQLLRSLDSSGLAILLVEQNLRFALNAARNVAIMSRGQIVLREATATVIASPDLQARYLTI